MQAAERADGRRPRSGRIELVFPADPSMVRLARLVASGVATSAGFDIDEVDDLRIAVDEGCAALIESGHGASLGLSFHLDRQSVDVYGTTESAGTSVDELRSSLSERILGVVADEHEFATDHGRVMFRICKRGLAAAPSSNAH
jgi:serine/threonine-protein kinase RsbW